MDYQRAVFKHEKLERDIDKIKDDIKDAEKSIKAETDIDLRVLHLKHDELVYKIN